MHVKYVVVAARSSRYQYQRPLKVRIRRGPVFAQAIVDGHVKLAFSREWLLLWVGELKDVRGVFGMGAAEELAAIPGVDKELDRVTKARSERVKQRERQTRRSR